MFPEIEMAESGDLIAEEIIEAGEIVAEVSEGTISGAIAGAAIGGRQS